MDYSRTNINNWIRKGMRKSFGLMMESVLSEHEDVVILVADVATSAGLGGLREYWGRQIFNVGIAEQNMTGIAAGMAKEGRNVFIVSFSPFVSMRNYEAVRTLIGYMHLNVKVVALGSGLSLGVQGSSHYCMEDIAIMRTIPGMTILSPADCVEESVILDFLAEYDGPVYLRLTGIDGTPGVYKEKPSFTYGVPNVIREGEDVALLATGSVVNECVRAARALQKENISVAVIDVHTMKPLGQEYIKGIGKSYKLIVTVEEHFINGGLGGIVAESLAGMNDHAPLFRIGIADEFPKEGDYAYMLETCGLTAGRIKETIINQYQELKIGRI